jgi:hypothetical protein
MKKISANMLIFRMKRMLLQSKDLDLGLRFQFSNLKRKSVYNKEFQIFKMNEWISWNGHFGKKNDRIEDDNWKKKFK